MNKRLCGKIDFEGDELFFKVTGCGIPLMLIAGGGGDGDLFLPLTDLLCDRFKVITYDRRANARSTMNDPLHFDIVQQSRDAIAVLKAAGEETAHFFGNSSGAVIALDVATSFPDAVQIAIIHEPPLARLHPQKEKWQIFFRDCYQRSFKFGGSSMAAMKFMFGIEVPPLNMIRAEMKARKYLKNEPIQPDMKRIPAKAATQFLIQKELIAITDYQPDIEKLKQNRDKVVIAAGTWSIANHTWLAEVARRLADSLDCEFVTVPGHHASFMDNPQEWATAIKRILE